jgi:hypothetical protein
MLETVGTEFREARTPMAPAVGELAFRIRGGELQGRIARVRASQCTIGSAPDCTLRLAEPGVRPLHCVIFRSDAGATVRRWSPDTQLNGRAFSDALLMAGDRLQIGPVELEVIDDAALAYPRSSRLAPVAAPPGPAAPAIPVASLAGEIVEHLKRDLDPQPSKSKLLRKRVRQARHRVKQLKTKLTRLQESSLRLQADSERFQRELEDTQARRSEADRQLQRLTQEGLSSSAAMDQLRREADDARHRLEREIVTANEDRKRLEQSLDEVRTRLAERDTELAQLRAELNQRLDDWRRERAEFQSSLETLRQRAAEAEQAHESAFQQRQQEQAAWQQERLALLQSLEDKQHLEQRLEELDKLRQWCDEAETRSEQASRAEAAAQQEALRLRERIAELEAFAERRMNAEAGEPAADDELQRQIEEARREYASLRAERDRLLAEVETGSNRFLSQADELAEMSRQFTELESRCHDLQGQLECRTAEQIPLLERIEQLEQQVIAASAAIGPAGPVCDAVESSAQIEAMEAELRRKVEELAATTAQAEQARQQLADRDASWTKREQELLKQLQCLENLARNLEENLRTATDQAAAEQAQAEKQELEQQLAAAQEKLATAQKQWNEQRELLEEQALSAHQQVQTLEEQLDTLRPSLEETRSQIRERDALLSQLRDEVRQQMAVWQRERNELQHELEQARLQEPGYADVPLSTESFPAESDSLADVDAGDDAPMPSANHAESQTLEEPESSLSEVFAEQAIVEPVASEEPTGESPVSVNDVLARLGAAGIWRDEAAEEAIDPDAAADSNADTATEQTSFTFPEQSESDFQDSDCRESETPVSWYASQPEAESAAESMAEPLAEEAALDSAATSDEPHPFPANAGEPASEDDDSIEAYMARLLKRVRGDAVADAFVVQQAATETKPDVMGEIPSAQAEPQVEPLAGPEEFVPRSQAPEQSVDLAAMRELAIHSARQAITQSTQRRQRQAALATTGIIVGSVLGSGALLYWGWQIGNPLAYAGAVATLVGGICWSVRRIRRAPRTRANGVAAK